MYTEKVDGVAGCLFYLWISRFSGCPPLSPLFPHDAAERRRRRRHLNAAKRPKFASSPHPEQPDIRALRMNSASHRRSAAVALLLLSINLSNPRHVGALFLQNWHMAFSPLVVQGISLLHSYSGRHLSDNRLKEKSA